MHDWQSIEAREQDLGTDELRELADSLGHKPWHDLCLDFDVDRPAGGAEPDAVRRAPHRRPAGGAEPDAVRRAPHRRHYKELFSGERLSTWLIHWGQTADTGFHDHARSAAAVHVIRGRVRDERLKIGREPSGREYGPGETFTIEPSDIHRVLHAGDEPALTVHAYSPPLLQMGAYMVEPDGTLTRHTIDHTQELRPLEVS